MFRLHLSRPRPLPSIPRYVVLVDSDHLFTRAGVDLPSVGFSPGVPGPVLSTQRVSEPDEETSYPSDLSSGGRSILYEVPLGHPTWDSTPTTVRTV